MTNGRASAWLPSLSKWSASYLITNALINVQKRWSEVQGKAISSLDYRRRALCKVRRGLLLLTSL